MCAFRILFSGRCRCTDSRDYGSQLFFIETEQEESGEVTSKEVIRSKKCV